MMAWRGENGIEKIIGYFVALAIMVVGLIGIAILHGDPFYAPLKVWPLWVLAVVVAQLMSSPLNFQSQAPWSRVDSVEVPLTLLHAAFANEPSPDVRTGSIEADTSRNTVYLTTRDLDGNICRKAHSDIQKDGRIWDLLYNGILYSVVTGATINDLAIELLKLNQTPAMELRD